LPEVQHLIIDQGSPMAAKMRSKPYRKQSRADWDAVRVKVMRWCLRVKLAQNWSSFGTLLKATGDRAIVEESVKDDFWGAHPLENGALVGANVLGRLLMELRQQLLGPHGASLRHVAPPDVPTFLLYSEPIRPLGSVDVDNTELSSPAAIVDTPQRDADRSPDVATRDGDAIQYLTVDEISSLRRFDVVLTRTALHFSRPLDAPALRGLWHLVSAIRRRRPKSEDWVNWLVGDWANEVDARLGLGSAERIIKEEEEAYAYTQHLLRLSGATLIALQWTEIAISTCTRLLEPSQTTMKAADVLELEPTRRKRTLGQLNRLLKDREIFVDDFERRMDRFVDHRNRFAHQLWTERALVDVEDPGARSESLRHVESFMLALLREAHDIGGVFKGLFAAIGVTIAERENIETFDRWFDDWKKDLDRFAEVSNRTNREREQLRRR
jgi:hypothetical protein